MKRLRVSDNNWPGINDAGGHCQMLENKKTGHACILICVLPAAEKQGALEVIATIVHESVHAWQFLCQKIGEKAPGIEMEAYGIEEISRGMIDAYSRTQGRGKKWPI
jgi:hypothetical protein